MNKKNFKFKGGWFLGILAALLFVSAQPVNVSAAGINDLKETLQTKEAATIEKSGSTTESRISVEEKFTTEALLNSKGPNQYCGDDPNICGQYAMSTILNYYGYSETFTDIKEKTNPTGLSFTAPDRISFYLKSKGLDVSYKNNGSVEEITNAIDTGNPVVCLVATEGSSHWITILGYKKNDDGSVKSVTMRDSYWGINSNYEMPIDEFQKLWNKPLGSLVNEKVGKITDTAFTYKNLMMTVSNKKSSNIANKIGLPGQFSTAMDDQLLNGANLAATGWVQKNPAKVITGAAEVLSGLPQKLITYPGTIANKVGQSVSEWGSKKAESTGTLNKAVGTLANGAGKVMQAAGTLTTSVGNAVSSVMETGFNNIKRLFNW